MNDIFTQATQSETPASQGDDALTTKLASIVNENGEQKYASVDVALDALKNSQDYIPTLKTELSTKDAEIAALRTELAHTQGVQSALERFTSNPQPVAQPEVPVAPQQEQSAAVDVNQLVQAAFQAHQQQTLAEKNLNEVNTALANKYGDKAVEFLKTKAGELGTTAEALTEMAKTNPTMAMTLLEANSPKTTLSSGTLNTAGFAPQPPVKLEAPKESLLAGASTRDVASFMEQVRAEVYREHGITS